MENPLHDSTPSAAETLQDAALVNKRLRQLAEALIHVEQHNGSGVDSGISKLHTTNVAARVIAPDRGVTLHTTTECARGDKLLSVPMSLCIKSSEYTGGLSSDVSLRLVAALLDAVQRGDRRADYFRKLVPMDEICPVLMYLWDTTAHCIPDEESRLRKSVAYKRAINFAAAIEKNRLAFQALENRAILRELFAWAAAVVRTRSFTYEQSDGVFGQALCPWIDLPNHRSNGGATARAKPTEDGEAVALYAQFALDVDDEITIDYDPDADFLDLFERYGFFDDSSVIHTVEIVAPLEQILQMWVNPGDSWRRELVEQQAQLGYDTEMCAWWVPDHHPEQCPLFKALRATLLTRIELKRRKETNPDDPLKLPSGREAEVTARVVGLIQEHLQGYGTALAEDQTEAARIGCNTVAAATQSREGTVLQLAIFEKQFLSNLCDTLQHAHLPDANGELQTIEE